jgi:hypothetical protein
MNTIEEIARLKKKRMPSFWITITRDQRFRILQISWAILWDWQKRQQKQTHG